MEISEAYVTKISQIRRRKSWYPSILMYSNHLALFVTDNNGAETDVTGNTSNPI